LYALLRARQAELEAALDRSPRPPAPSPTSASTRPAPPLTPEASTPPTAPIPPAPPEAPPHPCVAVDEVPRPTSHSRRPPGCLAQVDAATGLFPHRCRVHSPRNPRHPTLRKSFEQLPNPQATLDPTRSPAGGAPPPGPEPPPGTRDGLDPCASMHLPHHHPTISFTTSGRVGLDPSFWSLVNQ